MVPTKAFSVVGERLARVDGHDKLTGEALYVADIVLPRMLYGKILRSPFPHARIRGIDISRAQRLPGVRAVVTAEDTPKRTWGAFLQDQPILAINKVRYVGEEVAAVAAVDPDIAEEALDLIEVDYEELPAVFDVEEAMQLGAPLIHEDKERNIAVSFDVERGSVERAFAEAAVVVEDTFESHHQWHAAIETLGSVAEYKPSGKLTLWMNNQTIFQARRRIAWPLNMREGDIRIIQTYVGGGFGGKSCDDNNALVCAILTMKTGRPVKTINTREEEFLASRPRVPMRIWVRLGMKRDGTLSGKHIRVLADNGAYTGKAAAIMGVAALRHDTCYKYKDVKTQAYLVYTNKIPTGAFRGFGNPSAEWAIEQALDLAAHELGLGPREVALKNAAEPGYISPHGNLVISCELKQCIEKATELIGWQEKRAQRVLGRGLGLGCTAHVSGKRHFGDYDGASATIKVNEDGKVYIINGDGEAGEGAHTVFCQIAAEELGVPYEDVAISMADTDLTTFGLGAFGSRLTYVAGNAVKDAAAKVKQIILQTASEMLEANSEDLEIRNARIFVRGAPESKTVTVEEVARHHLFRRGGAPIIASGSFDADSVLQDETRYGNESGAYNFACQAAEVEVDRETGQVKILNYVAVSDCGTVINPPAAEGQVEGSIAQGIGYTLTEDLIFEEGRPLNPNYADYRIPCSSDMPPLKHQFAASYEPTGPFGAKGLGELGMDPFAAVIANAIFDAVGIRIHKLPITSEKVLKALREKEQLGNSAIMG